MPNKVPSLPYGDPKVNNQGQPQPRQVSDVFSAENIARAYSDIDNFIAERAPQIEQGILADRQRRINQSRVDMFKPKDFNPSGPNVPLFQSELVGNSISGPNPALYNSTMSNVDRVNQQIEMTRWNNQFNVDPNITSRIATFNGGKGVYDFNRFSTHPNFKQLGFSVYRDNENLYNEKSTWFDDFRRMTSTFDNLVGHAVLSTAGNWGFTGEGDSSDAREQQAMIQRASSTRPGFGSKVTNFGANAAYTVGIGVEILAENLLIKAASRFVPTIQAAHAPRNAMLTARFGKALYSLFKSIKPVNEARKVWSTINTSSKLASTIGRGALNLVPGYETGKFLYGALKSGTAINRLSTLSKMKGTFGAFYRDAREINLVTSEARLEGGGAQIAFTDKAVEEFRKKNGRFPNAEEGAAINALAVKANFETGYQNMAAIYLSNKIMFGDMLKGIPGARRMMKSNALNSTLFKIVNNPNWKKAGLAGPLSYAKKGLFADMKRTVFSKEWLKSVPSQMGNMFTGKALSGLGSRITGRGLRYFAGNITEGLQESFQEAVQFGAVDYYLKEYYKDLYGDPIIAAHNSMTRSILKGVEEQFSAQGLEVFLSGFFMGGMMQTAQSTLINPASRLLGSASDKIFKKTDYAEYVAAEKERFESFTKAYNDIVANTQEYASFFEDNLKQQKDLRNLSRMYEDVGETSDAVTARQDAMFKHIYTMLQTGHYDTLLDALNDFSQLNDQELAEAFPDDVDSTDRNKKTKHQRLQNIIKYAQEIKQDYEDSLKIENPYNPDLYDKSSNPSGYADELRGYRGVEFARSLLVFNKFSSRRTLERMESIFNNYFSNSKLGGTGSLDLSILFDYHGDPKKFQDYENTLKLEIAALSSSPEAADKKKADIKLNQLNNLRNLMDRVFEFRTIQNIISKAGVREGDAKYVKDLAADIRKEKAAIISSTSAVDPDGKIKPDEDVDSIADDVIITQYLKETLSEAYRDYLKSVYEVNGITPEDTTIDDSFEEFFDFTKLGTEYKRNAAHLNLLANPLSLMELAERYKAAVGAVESEFTRLHTEAYEKFVTYLSESKFLQKLDDLGIYFNPDSVESFLKDDILPDAFIDKETGKIIRADDPRYEQIIDLIEEHELETGKTFKNKPKAFTPAPATPPVATPPAPASAATPPPPASTTPTPAGSTSTGDPLAAYPADIQEKLKEAYAKSGVRVPITEWIKTSPKAATIIKGPAKKKKKPSSKEGLISETNPKTITNKLIETIYTIFKPFFTAGMKPKYVLNSDESAYVNTENINEEIERVSTIKGVGPEDSLILRRQSSRGNIIDDRLRSFATPLTAEGLSLKDLIINAHIEYERTGDPSELDAARTELRKYVSNIVRDAKTLSTPLNISDGFVDQFTQILEDLALEFRDYTWYTSMPAMVGSFLGSKYAGTVDLILEKDGKYTIVDFKTSEVIRRSRPDLYKVSDQIQQNAYREAFLQNTGENPDMAILNFVITTANDKKDITSVKLDKYKNTEGEMSVLIPVKEMSVLQAKIEQLNVEKNKELSQIEKNASFDNKTKAELKKAVEEKYAAEINELEVKSKAESEKPPVPPAPAAPVSDKKADIEKRRQEELDNIKPDGKTSKDRRKILMKNEDSEKTFEESLIEAGYINVQGVWVEPDINLELLKSIPQIFWEYLADKQVILVNDTTKDRGGQSADRTYKGESKPIVSLGKNTSKEGALQLIAHELGHSEFRKLSEQEKESLKDYGKASTWYIEGLESGQYKSAAENYEENFVENYAADLLQKMGISENVDRGDIEINPIYKDILDRINAKYDAELDALEGAKPAESKVEVISENYTPELLRANPNKLFLFGDNNTRTGKGGQAVIRDEPNAAGISTKLLPKNTPEAFMSDDQLADNKAVIDSDIKKAKDRAAKEGKTIVLPKGGFGTGLAALATKAPQTFAYLNQRLQEEFGFNNTTGELAALKGKGTTDSTSLSDAEKRERIKGLKEIIKNIEESLDGIKSSGVKVDERDHASLKRQLSRAKRALKAAEDSLTDDLAWERYKLKEEEQYKIDKVLMSGDDTEEAKQKRKDEIEKIKSEYAAKLAALEGTQTSGGTPSKTKAPSRFAGKIIYSIPGFTDPKIFEIYDVINADDVLKKVASDMGYGNLPGFEQNFGSIIYSLKEEEKNAIYENFDKEITNLKNQGKTIVTSNFRLIKMADVISSPDKSKAVDKRMYAELTTPEKLDKNYTIKGIIESSSQKGWSVTEKGLETKTKKTVSELLGSETITSNRLEIIDTTADLKALSAIANAYFKDKEGELRNQYNVKDKSGNVRVLDADEVAKLFIERAKDLAGKLVTNGSKEFSKFERKIQGMLAKEKAPEAETKEEAESINKAAEAGRDISDLSTEADKIISDALKNKQKKADRRKNLKDKFGC